MEDPHPAETQSERAVGNCPGVESGTLPSQGLVQDSSRGVSRWKSELSLLAGIVFASTLPFLNRAIHLDENTYLAYAQHVARHPWFPGDFPGLWFGVPVTVFAAHTHPPGMAYFLALLMRLLPGNSTAWLRFGFIVFPLMYAVSGYFLARRFTRHPLATTSLMMVTPAVMIFSPVLMPDLPMTALWLSGIACFLSGLEGRKKSKLLLGGAVFTLATFVSYQSLFIILLMAFYAWWKQSSALPHSPASRGRKDFLGVALIALFLPVLALAAYTFAEYIHFSYVPAKRAALYLVSVNVTGASYLKQKALGALSTLGGTSFFFLSVLWVAWRRLKLSQLGILLALTTLCCLFLPRAYSFGEKAEYFVLALCALLLLGLPLQFIGASARNFALRSRKSADCFLLTAWIMGVVVYTIFLCEFSAARYFIAIVPPLAILFELSVEQVYAGRESARRKFIGVTILATCILAFVVNVADYQFVGSYRDFAVWFSNKYPLGQQSAWIGTEAGLRYYMEGIGARALVNENAPDLPPWLPGAAWGKSYFGQPHPGDILVRPKSFLRYSISPELEKSPVIESRVLTSTFPLRTYGPDAHAGLHGTNVGLLPFVFSRLPFDQIDISRYGKAPRSDIVLGTNTQLQ